MHDVLIVMMMIIKPTSRYDHIDSAVQICCRLTGGQKVRRSCLEFKSCVVDVLIVASRTLFIASTSQRNYSTSTPPTSWLASSRQVWTATANQRRRRRRWRHRRWRHHQVVVLAKLKGQRLRLRLLMMVALVMKVHHLLHQMMKMMSLVLLRDHD